MESKPLTDDEMLREMERIGNLALDELGRQARLLRSTPRESRPE
jgi:hypothetical protein